MDPIDTPHIAHHYGHNLCCVNIVVAYPHGGSIKHSDMRVSTAGCLQHAAVEMRSYLSASKPNCEMNLIFSCICCSFSASSGRASQNPHFVTLYMIKHNI